MASRNLDLLMIHGSWQHGALFQPVAEQLAHHGWQAHTPTVAGHDPAAVPDPDITLAEMVDSVRAYVESRDLTDLTIYAHSAGGVILTQLAPQIRQRIRRLVFHNAFVVEDGSSGIAELPPMMRDLISQRIDEKTRTVTLPFPVWREAFIQDADIATAQASYEKLIPEPLASMGTTVGQSAFYALAHHPDPVQRLPISFLNGTSDTALPEGFIPGLADQPENGWGWVRHIRRLGSPRLVEIPEASHAVMFTNPGLLASKIVAAARD